MKIENDSNELAMPTSPRVSHATTSETGTPLGRMDIHSGTSSLKAMPHFSESVAPVNISLQTDAFDFLFDENLQLDFYGIDDIHGLVF